ncbi:sensor histidine kinase, partial [Streptomyces sp. SB3404]|nr:sensor histidine kinase [Streptomyces boncukensis]
MRISRRLILLVAVPLIVAIAFAGRALTPATGQAVQADRLRTAVEVSTAAGDLAYRLQHERAEAAARIASDGSGGNGSSGLERFQALARATDRSVARYRERSAGMSAVPSGTAAAQRRIDKSLGELASLRAQVRSGSGALSSMAFGYRIVLADLISFRDSIAQANGVRAGDADHIRAAAALTEAAEYLGQQEVSVLRAHSDGGFTPASLRTFEAARIGYTDAYRTGNTLGDPQWRTWLERTLSGPKAMAAEKLAAQVARSPADRRLAVDPNAWRTAMSDRQELLRTVIRRVDADVHETVSAERTRLIWWAVAELCLVLLTLVGVVLIATRLGRDLIRRLRALRDAAHEVAHQRLPEVVSTLSQPGSVGRASPDQIADEAGKPLVNLGDDEMGEVGEAFNSVHHAAVRLAAQQAESHERFAQTLVTVARRGAQLNAVLTNELSSVQRDELDPERMEALFALDHLAIRMERNANNLLVLGGYGHGKVRSADAPCATVIYAAAQQIERYGRVSLGHVEQSIGVAARAVDDVAHLLAELLDNATRFSPPETRVGVAAWHLWDRAVLQIVDEGVGLPPERRAELNAELATPQRDVGAVRSMGLQVVARLAARHGVTVELRASSGPGTIAEVILPKAVLAEPVDDDSPLTAPRALEELPGPLRSAGAPRALGRPSWARDAEEDPDSEHDEHGEHDDGHRVAADEGARPAAHPDEPAPPKSAPDGPGP